jgi:serine/threonine protein kinase
MSKAAADSKTKRVGKYELGRTLGEGTFGKVKYAVNTETNEAVAIKVLDKEKIQKQNMGNQIKKEISIMKMVKHKYIVGMIEVLASKTKIFIVLDLVTGGELFDKIVSVGKLSEEQALFYFGQLVEGVEYCHKMGVCHRDLKPENLLLDENGNLKISDFGLSSLYVGDADGDGTSRTEILHTTCGTPNYVAPEVLADQGYDGKKADVWSIGVILYVLLAGFLPFDESTIVALFSKIQAADFTYPSWFSTEVRAVLDLMIIADPKKRVSLAKLKENAWLRFKVPEWAEASSAAATAPASASASAAEMEDAVTPLPPSITDKDFEDFDAGPSTARRGLRSLNAFDLVNQCGGFNIDKLFSPQIFSAISDDFDGAVSAGGAAAATGSGTGIGASGVGATSPGAHGAGGLVRGATGSGGSKLQMSQLLRASSGSALRFGGAANRRTANFYFSSPVAPAEVLVQELHKSLVDAGFTVEGSLESCVAAGRCRGLLRTPKGMVGMGVQVFRLTDTTSLVEVRRGKGDLLEWNAAFHDLVDRRMGQLLNRVPEGGEAKSTDS